MNNDEFDICFTVERACMQLPNHNTLEYNTQDKEETVLLHIQ
jgi:hypothetical protein